jgi:hypothetical protein
MTKVAGYVLFEVSSEKEWQCGGELLNGNAILQDEQLKYVYCFTFLRRKVKQPSN